MYGGVIDVGIGPAVVDGLALDDIHSLAQHLLAVVIQPLQVRLFSLSHLLLQLELPLHLLQSHHLDLVLKLLPHPRHLLELLKLHLVQFRVLWNFSQ